MSAVVLEEQGTKETTQPPRELLNSIQVGGPNAEYLVPFDQRLQQRDTHPQDLLELEARGYIDALKENCPTALENPTILIGGLGVSGGNVGFELAAGLAEISKGLQGTWIIVDPDKVEEKNVIHGQPYRSEQVGRMKVDAFCENLQEVHTINGGNREAIEVIELNPTNASEILSNTLNPLESGRTRIIKVPRGLELAEIKSIAINFRPNVMVDGVDFTEPEAVYDLHEAAKECGRPVLTGLDIGDTVMVTNIIRKRKADEVGEISRIEGLFSREDVDNYNLIRGHFNALWLQQVSELLGNGRDIPSELMTTDLYRLLQKNSYDNVPIEDTLGRLKAMDSPTTIMASYYLVSKEYLDAKDISPLLFAMINNPQINDGSLSLPSTGRVMGAVAAAKGLELIAQQKSNGPVPTTAQYGLAFKERTDGLNAFVQTLPSDLLKQSGISDQVPTEAIDNLLKGLALAYQQALDEVKRVNTEWVF